MPFAFYNAVHCVLLGHGTVHRVVLRVSSTARFWSRNRDLRPIRSGAFDLAVVGALGSTIGEALGSTVASIVHHTQPHKLIPVLAD